MPDRPQQEHGSGRTADAKLCPRCDIGLDCPCLRSAHEAKFEEMVERGAHALTEAGVNAQRPVGDVLHDYDWTPIEAARAVLMAALKEERG